MSKSGVSKEFVAKLLVLLSELEGQIGSHPDPSLLELRNTVGAALAALYRVTAEQALNAAYCSAAPTRH